MKEHPEPTILSGAPPTNGQVVVPKQFMLLLNTAATLLLFPIAAFISKEVWEKLDRNNERLIRVETRQQFVIESLPAMQGQLKELSNKVDSTAEKLTTANARTSQRLDNVEKAILELKKQNHL